MVDKGDALSLWHDVEYPRWTHPTGGWCKVQGLRREVKAQTWTQETSLGRTIQVHPATAGLPRRSQPMLPVSDGKPQRPLRDVGRETLLQNSPPFPVPHSPVISHLRKRHKGKACYRAGYDDRDKTTAVPTDVHGTAVNKLACLASARIFF